MKLALIVTLTQDALSRALSLSLSLSLSLVFYKDHHHLTYDGHAAVGAVVESSSV